MKRFLAFDRKSCVLVEIIVKTFAMNNWWSWNA